MEVEWQLLVEARTLKRPPAYMMLGACTVAVVGVRGER